MHWVVERLKQPNIQKALSTYLARSGCSGDVHATTANATPAIFHWIPRGTFSPDSNLSEIWIGSIQHGPLPLPLQTALKSKWFLPVKGHHYQPMTLLLGHSLITLLLPWAPSSLPDRPPGISQGTTKMEATFPFYLVLTLHNRCPPKPNNSAPRV